MHTCQRCGKVFNYRSELKSHLSNKKPCKPTVSDVTAFSLLEELAKEDMDTKRYICNVCGGRFKNTKSKWKHQSACTKTKQLPDATPPSVEQLASTVATLQAKIAELEAKGISNTTNNNTTNNNINNIQNNIHLHNFGSESLDHLPQSFLNRCFAMCIEGGEGMVRWIKDIHFDDECPENHNVRLKSSKRELMEVYSDGKWVVTDQDKVLTDLIEKGYRVLRSHGRKHKDGLMEEEDLDKDEYDDIVDWLEKVYDDSKEQKPIKRELLLLILNRKPMLLGRDC